jgi:hypothetical protein
MVIVMKTLKRAKKGHSTVGKQEFTKERWESFGCKVKEVRIPLVG